MEARTEPGRQGEAAEEKLDRTKEELYKDFMEIARLASEADLAGWREAARQLRGAGVPPDEVIWTVDPDAVWGAILAGATEAFTVPRHFMDLAADVILHRSAERFALLYRLIWRMGREQG